MDVGQHIKVDWSTSSQAHGGYCDVFIGSITRECLDKTIDIEQSGDNIKVAVKRLRVNLKIELLRENGVKYFKVRKLVQCYRLFMSTHTYIFAIVGIRERVNSLVEV